MYDLIIKGGTVVDGSGGAPFLGDVAVKDGFIAAVGQDLGSADREIDAKGCYVTPGFVDIHTHYDGQASAWHGITTVVMGNCGVGFAPAAKDRHDWLIGLMEGVEDIPGSALSEGMEWNWESFPEYLDALESLPRSIDIATQVPHGAVRAYVMGDRGAANEAPTETDIARMSAIVEEGLRAGALGFSTSRTVLHKSVDGVLVPGTTATPEELLGIGRAMGRVGYGVFELSSDLVPEWNEFEWMGALSRETGLPVSFTALQSPIKAMALENQLASMRDENARGAHLVAQIALRGTGLILGWQATFHPFAFKPSWSSIKDLTWPEQLEKLKDAKFKEQLLAEEHDLPETDLKLLLELMISAFQMQYPMGDGFDYEPTAEDSIAALAGDADMSPEAFAYDAMMANDGQGFIYFPLLNYADGNLDFLEPILESDDCVNSLSDGGTICDAAATTFLLQHWVRDRSRGRIPIEQAIRRQCANTARLYGLDDRGLISEGYLADLNIIDLEALGLNQPWVAHDLPAGGMRLLQDARGYRATIKSGVVTFSDGKFHGEYPGSLIRGPQASPATASPQVAAID